MFFREIKEKKLDIQSGDLDQSGLNPLLCRLLNLRGITSYEDALKFLEPDKYKIEPFDVFCDSKKAIERTKKAIENQEKILVWGDFDADGVTSSAILYKTLKALKANFEVFIPNRNDHGHGLNLKELIKFISKKAVKLVITVDCGISNIEEAKLLKGFKVDLIVTDHHKAEDTLPDAYAIINPCAPDSLDANLSVDRINSLSCLCGAGVAYKFAMKLLEDVDNQNLKDELLVLACVGTISDVVPLLWENRAIVAKGLELINQNKHKGISKLFEINGRKNILSADIAFVLTPRINATGRLSTPDIAFNFLVEENESAFDFLIEQLDNYNKIRQNMCEDVTLEARNIVISDKTNKNASALVLYKEDWHIGIIGIVASKIVEEFSKPVFMITKGENNTGRCSIRSTEDYNVYEILKQNADLFLGWGGHSLAGGFSFDTNIHSVEKIKTAILDTLEQYGRQKPQSAALYVDKFIEPKEITEELIETIKALEPTGQNNPQPVFAIKDVELVNSMQIGKEANHLKFTCKKNGCIMECLKWRQEALNIANGTPIDIAFKPEINEFNGEIKIQLILEDIYNPDFAKKSEDGIKIYDHRKKTGILEQISNYIKKSGADILIWAKQPNTIAKLKDYEEISNHIGENKRHRSIMFFDYPSSHNEMSYILEQVEPTKIHIMKSDWECEIENTIKLIFGMIKYCCNKKDGVVDIEKMALSSGTSENFINIALEIFQEAGSIEIVNLQKIKLIAPVAWGKIYESELFKDLKEEFEEILTFKKQLSECDITQLLTEIISV